MKGDSSENQFFHTFSAMAETESPSDPSPRPSPLPKGRGRNVGRLLNCQAPPVQGEREKRRQTLELPGASGPSSRYGEFSLPPSDGVRGSPAVPLPPSLRPYRAHRGLVEGGRYASAKTVKTKKDSIERSAPGTNECNQDVIARSLNVIYRWTSPSNLQGPGFAVRFCPPGPAAAVCRGQAGQQGAMQGG
jgi:hypothetical protein